MGGRYRKKSQNGLVAYGNMVSIGSEEKEAELLRGWQKKLRLLGMLGSSNTFAVGLTTRQSRQ
jgi:hypothetical protein